MNLIIITGAGAVGKMTVGQELMKITDYRLFHNHMMIEPVIDIFGRFNGAVVNKLRNCIFDEYIKSDNIGMIFTYMWAFDMQSDWDYITGLKEKFEASGGTVYLVELVADQSVRIERNKTENRLANKASKRNITFSQDRMLREETKYRLVSNEGEIPFDNYIKIDNTDMEPGEAARRIKEFFKLPDKVRRDDLRSINLEAVRDYELDTLLKMQKESFQPLYEKYRDEGSPVLETPEVLRQKYNQTKRDYLFILVNGARVGAVSVCNKSRENDDSVFFISPIFILPRYQNLGYGYAALQKVFQLYPQARLWKLDTILEEPRNCHLYEKCGFVKVGEPHPVNERLTLVDYVMDPKK